MLKFLTLFLMVATLAILATCYYELSKEEAKCLNEHNVTQEELPKVYGNFIQGNAIDRKIKCLTKCLFDLLDNKDENGKLDVNKFFYEMSRRPGTEMEMKVGNECKSKYDSEKDECEYVFGIMFCLSINTKKEAEKKGST